MVTRRKGEMVKMENTGERINLEFDMPSRGIIGLRTNVLTASAVLKNISRTREKSNAVPMVP